jgi:hypothetical protein
VILDKEKYIKKEEERGKKQKKVDKRLDSNRSVDDNDF